MSVRIAIIAGLALGLAIDLGAFALADLFEVNLFHIGDAA
jgi:hypothetical protein